MDEQTAMLERMLEANEQNIMINLKMSRLIEKEIIDKEKEHQND
ncbi:MAG: hypothetical protein WCS51_03455 [Bacilli bacterium]|jgi:hypothetical protein